MGYEIRRATSREHHLGSRWIIHGAGYPNMIVARATTRWGAARKARRYQRLDDLAARSYKP